MKSDWFRRATALEWCSIPVCNGTTQRFEIGLSWNWHVCQIGLASRFIGAVLDWYSKPNRLEWNNRNRDDYLLHVLFRQARQSTELKPSWWPWVEPSHWRWLDSCQTSHSDALRSEASVQLPNGKRLRLLDRFFLLSCVAFARCRLCSPWRCINLNTIKLIPDASSSSSCHSATCSCFKCYFYFFALLLPF